jgi:hypothetical protein
MSDASPRSPLAKDHLILPDWDTVLSECPDPEDDDYIRPAIGECLDRPRVLLHSPSLTTVLQNARLEEAREALAQAEKEWGIRLSHVRESNIAKVQTLLEKHFRELSAFSEGNALPDVRFGSPAALEALYGRDPAMVIPAKRIGCAMRPQPGSRTVLEQRRRIVGRHKAEILAVNAECARSVAELEAMRDMELERKRMAIQAVRKDPGETEWKRKAAEPANASRVMRLSLKLWKPR